MVTPSPRHLPFSIKLLGCDVLFKGEERIVGEEKLPGQAWLSLLTPLPFTLSSCGLCPLLRDLLGSLMGEHPGATVALLG